MHPAPPKSPNEAPAPLAASVNETCRITALSRTTIYALLKANRLEAVKLGRRTLIKMSSVRRLLGES